MSVHITTSLGRYTRPDAQHYQAGADGTLRVFEDGQEVLTYAPGQWYAVEIETNGKARDEAGRWVDGPVDA